MDESYLNVSDGSGDASLMHVQADRSIAATTIDVDTVSGVPTKFIATQGTLLASGFIDPSDKCDFYGHVDGSNLEIDGFCPGNSDTGSTEGQVIVVKPNTPWADFIADFVQSTPPSGVVNAFAGSSAPDGWLMCDGASLVRATYPNLYAAIGTTFGAADGTHFNVPDLRGRSPLGVGARSWALAVPNTDVNTGTDQIAITANKNVYTGKAVVLTTSGAAPAGLTASTTYYVIVIDSTHIKLASSLANAVAGTAIDITSQGSGTHTLTFTGTNHPLGEAGGEDSHALATSETPAHRHQMVTNSTVGTLALTGANHISMNRIGNGDTDYAMDNGGAADDASMGQSGSIGGSTSHNILNPYIALNHIIKI